MYVSRWSSIKTFLQDTNITLTRTQTSLIQHASYNKNYYTVRLIECQEWMSGKNFKWFFKNSLPLLCSKVNNIFTDQMPNPTIGGKCQENDICNFCKIGVGGFWIVWKIPYFFIFEGFHESKSPKIKIDC